MQNVKQTNDNKPPYPTEALMKVKQSEAFGKGNLLTTERVLNVSYASHIIPFYRYSTSVRHICPSPFIKLNK